MAKTWLNNLKEKISDWYYDKDQFYLRTITDPFVDLGKEVIKLGPALAETFTPGYADVKAADNLFNVGLNDFKDGQYVQGAAEMVGAPFLGAAMIVTPDGADGPIKAAVRTRKKIRPAATKAGEFTEDGIDYVSYMSSQPGTPSYYSIPKSEVTRGAKDWVPTEEEIIKALAAHINSIKRTAQEGVRTAADKAAGYTAAIQKMDRKLSRKKDPADAKRSMYQTKARTGQLAKSDKPKVTEYLEEELAANFNPSKQAIKKNNFDRALQEWMDYLDDLGYDIVTKESEKAAHNIALNTWGKRFSIQKNGGSINYIQHFS